MYPDAEFQFTAKRKGLMQGLWGKVNEKNKQTSKTIHVWIANICKLGHGNKCKCSK